VLDYTLFTYINNLAGKWICLDSIAIFFAKYLVYYLAAGAAVVFFLIKNKKERIHYLFLVGASVVLSRLVITELIRLIWHRSRPFVDYQVNQLLEHSASGSFPSGHTAGLFALSAAIYLFGKKFYSAYNQRLLCGVGIAFFIMSFFIGLARIFTGIHFPLDILGGIVVGVLSAIIIQFLFRKPKARGLGPIGRRT